MLALTSSAGLVATAGSSVSVVGRTSAPAAEASATAANTSTVRVRDAGGRHDAPHQPRGRG